MMAKHLSTMLQKKDILRWSKPSRKTSVPIQLQIIMAKHLSTWLQKKDILRWWIK
jgi:hypothetical protein